MRKTLTILLALCLTLTASADRVRRGCVPQVQPDCAATGVTRAGSIRQLSRPTTDWDASRIYRVPVILVAFTDRAFSMDDPQGYYDRLFNEPGYNERHGAGCVADYFRDQSSGRFNIQFDVVGPVALTTTMKGNSEYGTTSFRKAAIAADSLLNYSLYDWNGDGRVEQVICVYAGYGGNETSDVSKGCIWPNTSTFSSVTLDGVTVSQYSASAELWVGDSRCGIGTICHEFSHCLGLPDLYSTSGGDIVLDEWDLMDGGNYADDGWCPPNYSAHEREFMGWLSPTTLTEAGTYKLDAVSDGGGAFKIVSDGNASEYYLLENRQQAGWDYMLPGYGLLVTHVDFDSSLWGSNSVNRQARHRHVDFIHADNRAYDDYAPLLGNVVYGSDGRNRWLQYTAYPFQATDGTTNDALTDTSTPAATLFTARPDGSLLMGQPVTEIAEQGGAVSFRFKDDGSAGIQGVSTDSPCPVAYYDLQGRRLSQAALPLIYIIRCSDGTTRKIIR